LGESDLRLKKFEGIKVFIFFYSIQQSCIQLVLIKSKIAAIPFFNFLAYLFSFFKIFDKFFDFVVCSELTFFYIYGLIFPAILDHQKFQVKKAFKQMNNLPDLVWSK